MKVELISFDTAILAKEKGFDVRCKKYYNGVDILHTSKTSILHEVYRMYAPTQSLLQRWLREVHNIDITISLVANDYGFYIHKDRNYTNKGENYGIFGVTYEEALEHGLQAALKLIK